MEMKEGVSIRSHLKQMKELTDRLAAIGSPIAEDDQVGTLLGSLPASYVTLVTALEARVDDDLQLNFVQQAITHEEQKRSVQQPVPLDRDSEPALAVSTRKYKCYGCGEKGHFRRDCPRKKTYPDHKASRAAEDNNGEDDSDSAFVVSDSDGRSGTWVMDSGASRHMTPTKGLFMNYQELKTPESVALGDGRTVEAEGVGNVHVQMLFKSKMSYQAVLYNVLYVPKLACNLFSVKAATEKGKVVQFGHSRCWIKDKRGTLRGTGVLRGKLYYLECEAASMEQASLASQQTRESDIWHQRLGHINKQQLQQIINDELATGIHIPKATDLSFCEGCVEGKMHRKLFKPVGGIRSTRKLQLVHIDICGPMQTILSADESIS